MIEAGKLSRVMIVGKGSLFLGRLTNLFDGVSFLVEKNPGANDDTEAEVLDITKTRVGLTLLGSEHGEEEMRKGASLVNDPSVEVVLVEADCERDAHAKMDDMLRSGKIHSAVTMHYSFPIGVSTVGRVITPGMGRRMFIANTTGTSDTDRVDALLKNTIQAIAVAKACGISKPTVGILNIDGSRMLERALKSMQEKGYDINFTESARADGGAVMRGNDLLQGVPDVMVMDSLTGNVMMKTLSAFTSGGSYESLGDGYGPGVGDGYDRIINIISRASGAPVIAGALVFAASCAKGELLKKVNAEFAAAKKAGLDDVLAKFAEAGNTSKVASDTQAESAISPPPAKVVTTEIPGIEILDLEDAVHVLWKAGIYASSGMGCTGPIVLVAPEDEETARGLLKESGHL
jgi:betaine reductase